MTISMLGMTKTDPDMNLLDLPDIQVDFGEVIGYSCALKNADDLFEFFIPYLEDWANNNATTHQFLKKHQSAGIALWTANDVEPTEEREATFQLMVDNDEIKGYVLMHCKLISVGVRQ